MGCLWVASQPRRSGKRLGEGWTNVDDLGQGGYVGVNLHLAFRSPERKIFSVSKTTYPRLWTCGSQIILHFSVYARYDPEVSVDGEGDVFKTDEVDKEGSRKCQFLVRRWRVVDVWPLNKDSNRPSTVIKIINEIIMYFLAYRLDSF